MAVLFSETFAAGSTVADYLGKKWTTFSVLGIVAFAEAASGLGANFDASARVMKARTFGSKGEIFISWLQKFVNVTAPGTILDLYDSADALQISLKKNTDGTLELVDGAGGTIATSSLTVGITTVYRYTLQVSIGASNTYRLAVDGADYLNGTGDTQYTGNANVAYFRFSSSDTSLDFVVSDIALWDTAGSVLNGWQTGVKPVVLRPNSDGNSSDWTPLSSTNVSNVDETTRDEDSTYNSTSTATDLDLFGFETLSGDYDVFAVVSNFHLRKDDGAAREARDVCRQASTNYNGTTKTVAETYENFDEIREVDPNTSAAWSVAGVNSSERGPQMVS